MVQRGFSTIFIVLIGLVLIGLTGFLAYSNIPKNTKPVENSRQTDEVLPLPTLNPNPTSLPAFSPQAKTDNQNLTGICGSVNYYPNTLSQNQGDQPTKLAQQLEIFKQNGDLVATTTSSADGTFKIPIPPGNYVVKTKSFGVTNNVTVKENDCTNLEITITPPN